MKASARPAGACQCSLGADVLDVPSSCGLPRRDKRCDWEQSFDGATRMAAVLLCVVGLPPFGAALAQHDAAAAKGDSGAARLAPGSLVVLKLPELPLFDEARAISAEDQLTLTVERAESGRLLLASRDKLIRGWIYDDEVVPLDGAIDYFSQALIRERSNPEDYWVLGRLWSYRNDNVRALVFLKRAIGRYSDQSHFFVSRGLAYLRTGKLREALEDCELAITLDPESSKARLVRHQAGHAAMDRSPRSPSSTKRSATIPPTRPDQRVRSKGRR